MLDQAPGLAGNQAVVALRRIDHAYAASTGDRIVALRDVSLDVAKNEFVSIVGPSGCGKSTLLRVIAGLLSPEAGDATVLGARAGLRKADVSLVFQRPALLPWFNVLDNVLFPLRHMERGVDAAATRRAMDLLTMMGVGDCARLRPNELSGGMQQRVAICRALITEPRVLLMDEPFAALDALTREQLGIELLRLCTQRPKTVLFVTHSIPEAVMLSDRIAVMSSRPGQIREICRVPFRRPRDPAVTRDPAFLEICSHVRDTIH
jgi:NitT/TauT family transport system ATP-binding protein